MQGNSGEPGALGCGYQAVAEYWAVDEDGVTIGSSRKLLDPKSHPKQVQP